MPRQSARDRFRQDSAAVRIHADLVDSSAIQRTLDVVLNVLSEQYAADMSATCSLNHYRMQGAQDFVKAWCSLADVKPPQKRIATDTLLDEDAPKLNE